MSPTLAIDAADRVLCLAPHPDDETLAAAGLLQHGVAAGAALRVLFATDGENNPWAQRAVEQRWRVGAADRARWGARRRREALAALARLGVPDAAAIFLGLPDQGLTRELLHGDGAAMPALAREIERFAPTILVAPAACDRHPDHSALAVLARFALDHVSPRRRPLLLDYVVHGRRGAHSRSVRSWRLALTDEQVARKRAAICAHRSQIFLRQRSLLAFATSDEVYASETTSGGAGDLGYGAAIESATLLLHLPHETRLAALGDATLYLAVDDRHGGRRLRIALPHGAGSMAVMDVASETPIAEAVRVRNGSDRGLRLPLALFRGATSTFAKIERRHVGFLDGAGWSRFALPYEPRASPAKRYRTLTPPSFGADRASGALCPTHAAPAYGDAGIFDGMSRAPMIRMPLHSTARPRVLVAEDDRGMRDLIVASFQDDGYDVTAAGDLDRLGESVGTDTGPDTFAAIVTDNRMPGCSGLELLAALRAARWGTPVILITAFGSEATHREAMALGAIAVLDKPFPLEHLRAVVRAAIRPC